MVFRARHIHLCPVFMLSTPQPVSLSVTARLDSPAAQEMSTHFVDIDALSHCPFATTCYTFSIFLVHIEPFEKYASHSPAGFENLVITKTLKIKL